MSVLLIILGARPATKPDGPESAHTLALLDLAEGKIVAPPTPPDMSRGYVWALFDTFDIFTSDLDGKNLKVVVDASNGMAGTMSPKIFGKNGENVEGLEIIELARRSADAGPGCWLPPCPWASRSTRSGTLRSKRLRRSAP